MSISPQPADKNDPPRLLTCYIDRCDEPATYFVHSYPDDVRLCGPHSSLHPIEAGETECDVDCRICAADAGVFL